jgi:L-amino acid N-acyltransferase YncA
VAEPPSRCPEGERAGVLEYRKGLATGHRTRRAFSASPITRRSRDRSAYRYRAEDSVYVREDVRGQGVGKALVARLIEDATARGMRQMIAVIGASENIGSIGVHASLGFQMVGTLRSAGVKFGRL